MARKSTEERRKEITEGLLEAMAEHGYAGASIKRIAARAGLTPGLIHYHFDTKQAILLALLKRLFVPQIQVLRSLADEANSAEQALESVLEALLSTGDSADPKAVAAWVTIGTEAIREPEINEAYSQALLEIEALFESIVERGVDSGEFDAGELSNRACAAALLAVVEGYFTVAATCREAIPQGTAAQAALRMAKGLLQR